MEGQAVPKSNSIMQPGSWWRKNYAKYIKDLKASTRKGSTILSNIQYLKMWLDYIETKKGGVSDGISFRDWCEAKQFARGTCHMLAGMVKRFHD